ncbi:tRNA pseudouridine38-40 synthase [Desulfosalsimonas propionicica]|uniref:tRNA pseudouridine synthase A n=1 Tax=Desulfosalsimonas propionicica TaxID=332175 RepID=A0A7W0C8D3_9BACT|nr:tRNA pseudouridine(38-40) synthase TruA [Desulfosalsimonas propionicica]MBA2880975.1 tRNA pseudouridine38-40 synthase [Desulfosalsimonas propionicica]
MQTFKLIVEYDGTDFNGWQIQKTGRTIQGQIEKALFTMTRQPVRVTGSGRTDAGVHALGQSAHFRCQTRLTPDAFFSGLNSLLPEDIVIRSCTRESETFHARYDVRQKTYRYYILNRPLAPAIGRQYAWHIAKPIDIKAMVQAARHVKGTHDFGAFENTGSPRSHSIRTISTARFLTDAKDPQIIFEITANGFLRYMVRNILGTLVETGLGRMTPEEMPAILDSKDRSHAGATAPAHGLFLVDVEY